MSNTTRIALACAAALCASTGCIQRTLRIETDPPGASVWVNGDAAGTTPAEVPFVSYGAVEIFMQMDDHATRKEVVRLRPPWYAVFPIDFVSDVLYPGTLHDRKTFGFKLDRLAAPDFAALRSRAEEFRARARELLARERRKRGLPAPDGATSENPPAADTPKEAGTATD